MPYFDFDQNNSGGSFDHDEKNGLGYKVLIEADSAAEANQKAESIGIYFDGCSDGRDCPCCGDRWYPQWADDRGTEKPEVYGKDVYEAAKTESWWVLPIYVHHKDGRVERVDGVRD